MHRHSWNISFGSRNFFGVYLILQVVCPDVLGASRRQPYRTVGQLAWDGDHWQPSLSKPAGAFNWGLKRGPALIFLIPAAVLWEKVVMEWEKECWRWKSINVFPSRPSEWRLMATPTTCTHCQKHYPLMLYDVAILHLMAPMDFWRNSTPFFGVANPSVRQKYSF